MIKLGASQTSQEGETGINYIGEYGSYQPQMELAQYIAAMVGQGKAQQDDIWGGQKYAKKFGSGLFGYDPFSGAGSDPRRETVDPMSPEVPGAGGPPRGPAQTGSGGPRSVGTWTPPTNPPTRTNPGDTTKPPGGGGGGNPPGGGGGGGNPPGGGGNPPGGGGGGKDPIDPIEPVDPRKPTVDATAGPVRIGDISPEEYMARWNSYRRTA